ncbi:Imm52 family immunity protein [Streptomyces sp. NPDC014676]|uniref:Imm52 family immunity protein n=1 Tax=Streptomyces sp. NPDC014676 TaxID=3364879 RepID=UPI0036F60A4B
MRRVVRGFWGPRQESAEELAARWSTMLDRFARLLPQVTGTWRTAPASGPAEVLQPDEPSLLAALRTARTTDDWSAANGTSLRLLAENTTPGWKVEIAALAGGTPEYLLQSLVATIVSPDEAPDLPDVELLAAVAESWVPDYGDVSDRAVTSALKKEAGFRIGTPSVGWAAYLSAGRAARAPLTSLPDSRTLPTGGVLLTIAPPGDTATVVKAYRALRESGALDPLPHPMTRPAL